MILYGTIFFFLIAAYSQGGRGAIPPLAAATVAAVYEYLTGRKRNAPLKIARTVLGLFYWVILALILVPK
jgi:hypothetical protein